MAFEGGPLTFHPTLVKVFAQRLKLSEKEILLPEHPELMVAYGAAVSLETMFEGESRESTPGELLEMLMKESGKTDGNGEEGRSPQEAAAQARMARPFFADEEEKEAFLKRHKKNPPVTKEPLPGQEVWAYLGIDSGSTTTKFVLMDEQEEILDSFYAPNEGEPLAVARRALIAMRDRYRKAGARLHILAAGTTGYGEVLFSKAFQAEYHTVETVAHARAAGKYVKDATFILDIGGQDMKAIWLDHGIITNILVNEACLLGMRFISGKLCLYAEDPGRKDRGRGLCLPESGGAGKPVYCIYEQQYHHGAEKRKAAGGHHGRTVPFHHRERVYQGGAAVQSGFPGRPYRCAGRDF